MTKEKLINDILQGLLMAAVVAAAVPMPDLAWAQNLQTAVSTVHGGIASMPSLISGGAYIAGAGTTFAGLWKLKTHIDQPTSVPMSQGLVRVGVGAGLLALPSLGGFMISSLGVGNAAATAQGFGTIGN